MNTGSTIPGQGEILDNFGRSRCRGLFMWRTRFGGCLRICGMTRSLQRPLTLSVVALGTFLMLPVPVSGQLLSGDLVAGVGSYPNFDAGLSSGAIYVIRPGAVSDALHSYEIESQGPHDLVNEISFAGRGVVFDRGHSLALLAADVLVELPLERRVSSFVRDRSGSVYIASGYGAPTLEKLSTTGELQWWASLPGVGDARLLAMDLAADQCTLWYSSPGSSAIYRFDVCTRTEKSAILTAGASAIRIFPDGGALVALSTGIARLDAGGRIRAHASYRLNSVAADREFVSLSVARDLETVWVAEGSRSGQNLVYQLRLDNFESATGVEHSLFLERGAITALAVYPEWRAADSPPARRRGVRRDQISSTGDLDAAREQLTAVQEPAGSARVPAAPE